MDRCELERGAHQRNQVRDEHGEVDQHRHYQRRHDDIALHRFRDMDTVRTGVRLICVVHSVCLLCIHISILA